MEDGVRQKHVWAARRNMAPFSGSPRSGVFPGMRDFQFRFGRHEIRPRVSNVAFFRKLPIPLFAIILRTELPPLGRGRHKGIARSLGR